MKKSSVYRTFLITVLTLIVLLIFFFNKESKRVKKNRIHEPVRKYEKLNTIRGIRLKKSFGDIKVELNSVLARPISFKSVNLMDFMIYKDYSLKLIGIYLRIREGDRFLILKADKALSNEKFNKFRIYGVLNIKVRGFSVPSSAKSLAIWIENNNLKAFAIQPVLNMHSKR